MAHIGVLSRYTRDHPQYWRSMPRDHNDAGLFMYGPQEARSVLANLVGETVCPVTAPPPAVALANQRHVREMRRRRLRFLQAAFPTHRGASGRRSR